MNPALLSQWQRLIFPPEPLPVRAGEQLKTGNRYPDCRNSDWQAHQGGMRTYAVTPVYPGPDGFDVCKFAVLDIDEGGDSLNKARALLAVCNAAGLSARAAWSGGKGCHVWLFCEPAPVALVRAVLNRLRAAVPFQGETIPGENQRAKLPPAFHQERRFWAFWFATLPDLPPALENAPTGFLDAQAGILAGVVPTAVPMLANYANAAGGERREPEPESDMQPDLAKLGGALPPCMVAFVEHGAQPTLGRWDKNALTLKRYAITAGLDEQLGLNLLKTLSDNTGPDFPTKKDGAARERHWQSIKEPGPFACGFILAARPALGFRCADCPARPPGVRRADVLALHIATLLFVVAGGDQFKEQAITRTVAELLELAGELLEPEHRGKNWGNRTAEALETALETLQRMKLVATVEYGAGYPDAGERGRGWVEKWLSATITLTTPEAAAFLGRDIPEMNAKLTARLERKQRARKLPRLKPAERLDDATAARLRARIAQRFPNQRSAADYFGCSQPALSRAANGLTAPNPALAAKLQKFLDSPEPD